MKEKPNEKKNTSFGYWCKHCGEPDSVMAEYSEMVYGEAALTDFESIGLAGYENHDSSDFNIDTFRCKYCEYDSPNLEEVATDNWDEVCKTMDEEKKEKHVV